MPPGPYQPLVALISANPAAIAPSRSAFDQEFPEARLWNILDDRLQDDAEFRGVTGSLAERMHRLIRHAVLEKADAILLTCPVYTDALRSYSGHCPVPLLDADETAVGNILNGAPRNVLVLASAPQPLAVSLNRFINETARRGVPVEIRGAVVEAAKAHALSGDPEPLAAVLADAVREQPTLPDTILLAQYSLGTAASALEAATGLSVFSGPASSAAALRRTILGGSR